MTTQLRAFVALVAASLLLIAVPAAHAATEVSIDPVNADTLSIVGDSSGDPTGTGVGNDGVTVSNTAGGGLRIEASDLDNYAPLSYTGDPGCTEQLSTQVGHTTEVGAVVCDAPTTAALTGGLSIGLFDGNDYLNTAGLTTVGDWTPENSTIDRDGFYAAAIWLDTGDDTFVGGPLSERLEDGLGADNISSGAGLDYLQQPTTADPAADDAGDTLDAGTGQDSRVDYSLRAVGVSVTLDGLANDGAPGENDNVAPHTGRVDGTDFNDTLTGSSFGQVLEGGDGNDVVDGMGGDDFVVGNEGDDTLTGGAGSDGLSGDEGDDIINMADGEDDQYVSCDGDAGNDGNDVVSVDAYPFDANVEGVCETVNRPASDEQPTPVGPEPTPVAPAPVAPAPLVATTPVAPIPTSTPALPLGLTVPAGAKVATDSTGAVKFAFTCGATKCAAKKLTLKAKVAGKTLKMTVKVPALAAGKKASVKLKLSKALAKAVAKAGKRGVKVTIAGPTGKPVKLTLVKKH
jgi:Ca2+-binding RTX toxin-like protein